MKETRQVSPLQITGVLTIIISLVYTVNLKSRPGNLKGINTYFSIFAFLLLFNLLFLVLMRNSFSTVGLALRTIWPIFLFFYLRKVITDKTRLKGVLITYLVSSVLPFLLMTYELFLSPISYVPISESRGGGFRLTGPYADLFNYMAYLIGDFIILTWLFLERALKARSFINPIKFYLMLGLIFLGVYNLRHQASVGVLIVLLLLFSYYSFRIPNAKKYLVPLVIIIMIGGSWFYYNYITELFAKEISVYEGEMDPERSFNGRVARWKTYFSIWDDMSFINKISGVGSSGNSHAFNMMSGGMHSDYVRFLFATGLIGLFFYLMFYFSLFRRRLLLPKTGKYLLFSCIIVMLMYSFSSSPLGSSGSLTYLVLTVFAFTSQPDYILKIYDR
jgi:hypothetical protein